MKSTTVPIHIATDKMNREFFVVRAGYEHPEALMKILNLEAYKINDPEGAEQRYHSDDNYAYHMMMPFYPPFGPFNVNFDTYVNVTAAIKNNDESYLVHPHDHLQYGRVKAYFDAVNAT